MKKNILMVFVFMIILASFNGVRLKISEILNTNDLNENIKKNEEANVSDELVLAEGIACSPYSPDGQVLYDFEITSEFPEIEKISEDYRTATFGLG